MTTVSLAIRLPQTLGGCGAIQKAELARKWFGDTWVDHYASTRDWEWREYQKAVTDWELQRYFEII